MWVARLLTFHSSCLLLTVQITNAYVSGMREDLNAFGNELNYYNVACKPDHLLRCVPNADLQIIPHVSTRLPAEQS